MNSQPLSKPDKQKSVGLGLRGMVGILAVVGVVFILCGELKRKQARASLDCPGGQDRHVEGHI